jgi:hypothetical protein
MLSGNLAGAILAVSLMVSCGAGPSGRQTTASVGRGDDTWLVGQRCTPETPADPAPRIEVLAAGSGQPVSTGMTVRVHYVATLPNGTVVHDSHDDDIPIEITLGSTNMICGFERALSGMRPGEQRRAVVPWSLAFGETGRPPQIPSRADLAFVIDLYLPADVVTDHGSPPANPAGGAGASRRR